MWGSLIIDFSMAKDDAGLLQDLERHVRTNMMEDKDWPAEYDLWEWSSEEALGHLDASSGETRDTRAKLDRYLTSNGFAGSMLSPGTFGYAPTDAKQILRRSTSPRS